jgi:hypothetical protein
MNTEKPMKSLMSRSRLNLLFSSIVLLAGLLHLGFEDRAVPDPADPAFALWRRQVVAGLHGTRCIRRAGEAP